MSRESLPMQILSSILAFIVALEHIYIMVLEMFLWTQPRTLKIFGISPNHAQIMQVMAANQGLYNGFLAAGLLVGVVATHPDVAYAFKAFFLLCVVIAGVYGGATVKPRIAMVQGGPAFIALVVTLLAGA